jgi:hypothetical protein
MAHGPGTALPVDELEAPGGQVPERGIEVGHTVGEVVKAGTSVLKKATDGGIRCQRLQELELPVSSAHEDQLDALGLYTFAAGTPGAGHGFEQRKHAVDGLDGDSDVVEGQALQGWAVGCHYGCLGRQFASLKVMANVSPGQGPGNRMLE